MGLEESEKFSWVYRHLKKPRNFDEFADSVLKKADKSANIYVKHRNMVGVTFPAIANPMEEFGGLSTISYGAIMTHGKGVDLYSAELGIESGKTKLVLNTYGSESSDPGAANTKMRVLDDALEAAFHLSSMGIEVTINSMNVSKTREIAAQYRSILSDLDYRRN